jgi:CRP/FNR family transcriptional regulator
MTGSKSKQPQYPPRLAQAALELQTALGSKLQIADRQTQISCAGDPNGPILLLASGWACRERVLPDGHRVIVDIYLQHDLIGAESLFMFEVPDSIVALTAISYYAISRDALKELLRKSPPIALHVMRLMVEERQRLCWLRTHLARMNAIERTAACILQLCERLKHQARAVKCDQGAEFSLPLTQQRLADYLGVHLTHLNRTLRDLRARGVAKLEGGGVIIHDADALKRAARRHRG